MIEVKDEILNGEPRYRLKDENGKVIYDNLSIEQITPTIQEGTPINKVLFDSIIYGILHSNLYNVPTAEEILDEPTVITSDPLPTFSDSDTSGTTRNGYTITCSSEYKNLGYAFSDTNSNSWYPGANAGECWCQVTFPNTIRMKLLKIYISYSYLNAGADSQKVEGLLENDEWETIATFTGVENKSSDVTIQTDSEKWYKAIRIKILGYNIESNTYAGSIKRIDITGGYITNKCNNLVIEDTSKEYMDGLILKIRTNEVIENTKSYLALNKLESKLINGTLTSNKYYEFAYNASTDVFDIVFCCEGGELE